MSLLRTIKRWLPPMWVLVLVIVTAQTAAYAQSGTESAVRWLLDDAPAREALAIPLRTITGPADLTLAMVYYHRGEYRLAIVLLDKINALHLPDGNADFVAFVLAESYRQLALHERARLQYRRVVSVFPSSDLAGAARYRQLQYAIHDRDSLQVDTILVSFTQSKTRQPFYDAVLYAVGTFYFWQRHYKEAQALLPQVHVSAPEYCYAQFIMALCYAQQKNWRNAMLLVGYVRSHAADKRLISETDVVLGDIYFSQNFYESAVRFYTQVPQSAPRYFFAQVKLARCYMAMGRVDQTIRLAEAFVRKYRDNEFSFEMASVLEQAYQRKGDQARARSMDTFIYSCMSNARISLKIMQEIDRLAVLQKGFSNLEAEGQRRNNQTLLRTAREEIGRVYALDKKYRDFLTELGAARVYNQVNGDNAGLTERRYTTLLELKMNALNDTINRLSRDLSTRAIDSVIVRDSLSRRRADVLKVHYDSLISRSILLAEEHAVVVDECLGGQYDQLTSESNLQVKFLDWAFFRYQNTRLELSDLRRERTKDLLGQKKKGHLSADSAKGVSRAKTATVADLETPEIERLNVLLGSDRQLLIDYMETLLDVFPQNRYNPQIVYRLAELYFDQAGDDFDRQLRTYEQNLAQGTDTAGQQFPEFTLDKVFYTYDRIIYGYPRDALADDAYFYKALALRKRGRDREATTLLERLIETYPESEYFVEANMNIGSYYFDHSKEEGGKGYVKAEQAYKRVLQYRDHPQFVQALYQLGWCYYMQDNYAQAISVFKYMIEAAQLDFDPSKQEEKQVANPLLREEAMDYIAISFNEEDSVDAAISFLKLIGNQDYAAIVLKRMGELRAEDMDNQRALNIYRRLLAEYPYSLVAPDAQINIIKLFESTDHRDSALVARQELFHRYVRGGAWQVAVAPRSSGSCVHADSLCLATGMFIADAAYRRAEATKSAAEYRTAVSFYRSISEHYPRDPRAFEARWNSAVILDVKLNEQTLSLREYLDYSQVVAIEPARREQAALAAIAVAQKMTPSDTGASVGDLDSMAVKLLGAVDNYVQLFPSGSAIMQVLLTRGTFYFNRKLFSKAALSFEQVVKHTPAVPEQENALFLLGQCYFSMEQWKQSVATLMRVYKESKIADRRTEAFRLLLQAEYTLIKQKLASNDYAAAAAGFIAIEDRYPHSEYGDVVLFSAGEAYEKLQRWLEAAQSFNRLAATYSESRLAPDALFYAALDYEKLNKYDEAAKTYEKLITLYLRSERTKDAVFNLALCYEKLGQLDKMAETNERYAQLFPGEKDVEAILLRSAQFYYKSKMYERAVNVYKNFIRRFGSSVRIIEAYYMLGQISRDQGDDVAASFNYSRAEERHKTMTESGSEGNSFFAAEAAFALATAAHKKFTAITFDVAPDKIKAAQKQKTEYLLEASKLYGRVIAYQSERMFEAAAALGQLYEDYAAVWLNQKRPALDPIKAAVFEKDIKQAAAVLLQKSFVPYVKALELASQFDSLKAEQAVVVNKITISLGVDYIRAGELQLEAIAAMQSAPIPPEIKAKPLYHFQYLRQLLETLEPLKAGVRDYFLNSYADLNAKKIAPEVAARCADRFVQIAYLLGNDYDKLSERILREPGIPITMSAAEKEDLLFQLEDIVYEAQDKAIALYEDAMERVGQVSLQQSGWYSKILESLARLSPEKYGKSFYPVFTVATDSTWLVRRDSVAGWNSAKAPADGWSRCRRAVTTVTPQFGAVVVPTISGAQSWSRTFFYKDIFIKGAPRNASVRLALNCPFRLFVNGTLVTADTVSRELSRVDSVSGITAILRGGNNTIAIEAGTTDSTAQAPALALLLSVMADTTQHFTAAPAAPRIGGSAARSGSAATFVPVTSSGDSIAALAARREQEVMSQYKNHGELIKAIGDYNSRALMAGQELRKERLALQKVQILISVVDEQLANTKYEITKLKKELSEMGKAKQ